MCEVECANGCSLEQAEKELYPQLDQIIDRLKDEDGALIPVLQETQELFGYLPEGALKKVSLKLDIPYSEVAGVVNFYSFFSTVPRGKHLIRVCLGTACYVRGGKELLEGFKKALGISVGETTEDRLFSLDIGRCFGACGLAPVIMIDDQVYQRVRACKIDEILSEYKNDESEQ
ncbi:complex I 24 kDa subunit family protein [Sedimentisphaera salicampi]|uniref:NADP-reducing hydrogenase subunit HndA n=1 Tax=Sedimentisphaera salicampi TaxID=1941349 RepID=A0A1W6LM37_9BACT|nr:NAD(P)H-dependent oxidoreductase subunit E [Sedimentisphaera salicampi]ARN56860.1 NADP-reducing hydrogenase subunit HndA [Sedimentisphaera salicampi]OXU15029.1 NADP-reducing hydrogenase subunit HndA [Sedimentisphaera salicampi]